MKNQGPMLAVLSALLFGLSPVLTKAILGEMSPGFMAGLLYLGSGIGLAIYSVLRRVSWSRELAKLPRRQSMKFVIAIIAGGILAPLALIEGLRLGTAFEVSVLLNTEVAFTMLLARLIFKEHIGPRVTYGIVALMIAGALSAYSPSSGSRISSAGLFLLVACILWGLDNNLTRDIEDLSPETLAGIKGLLAGGVNTAIAFIGGTGTFTPTQVVGTLIIGCLSYGASLLFFVGALRRLGSARTGGYFAIGPFFGMAASVLILRDQPGFSAWVGALIAGFGVWLLYGERHIHFHTHERLTHQHPHFHDEHHQHNHDGMEGPEPHDHPHQHERLTHAHVHWPDIHHRHSH